MSYVSSGHVIEVSLVYELPSISTEGERVCVRVSERERERVRENDSSELTGGRRLQ